MSGNNDDISNLLEEIRKNGNNIYSEENEEPSREWSHDDIDRLLEMTGHKSAKSEEYLHEEYAEKAFEATTESEEIKSEIPKHDTIVAVEEKVEPDSYVEQKTAIEMDKQAVDISKPTENTGDNSRLKALMEDVPEEKKSFDFSDAVKSAKNKFSGLFSGIKQQTQKLTESFRINNDEDEEEKRFILSDDDDFDDDDDVVIVEPEDGEELEDTDTFEDENSSVNSTGETEDKDDSVKSDDEETDEITVDDDEKTRVMPNAKADVKEYNDVEQGKTRDVYIEKPGIVMQKGETKADSGLEGAPTLLSADDALEKSKTADDIGVEKKPDELHKDDLKRKIIEAEMEGQIVLHGFEEVTESPEQVDEAEAEQELFEKRREKIRKFTLFGEEEGSDPYSTEEESEKLGELFDTPNEKVRRKENTETTFTGVEYTQLKDSRRVLRYLNSQKKKSVNKILTLGVLTLASFIVGIASAAQSSIAGDRILTIFSNFVLIAIALVVSNQTIVSSYELIKKKKVNINTGISIAAIVSFIQNLLMFILYFADANTVSVFSGTGVVLLFIGELNNYVTYNRTIDAMRLCTGENKDKLYSVEGITDDKDAVELGKNVKSASPRIRYSCKTKFPSHLIELCMSETTPDKMMIIVLPIIGILAVINLICAWLTKDDFATGFAAFTITLTMCVPAYGALLVQLPLRWTNKLLNCSGGLISSQESVNELCRTNAIIIDSRELFDQNLCAMHGYHDFKNVRVDDVMLYAAAMVIRSGGPLTGVFDQVVVNRREILPTVKSFNYEEKLGVSGWIYGQKVILGNRALMENHNIVIPDGFDEEKYHFDGYEVMFIAIAHKLAAMFVLNYAPNQKIAGMLKKLRDSSVTILVRNCDPNVTETMISDYYGIRLDNIKIINSAAGRVFKKYKSRPKLATRAVSIHDGSVNSFMKSLCYSATLKHVFKFSKMLMFIGIFLSFAIILTLALLNVIADLPAVFTIVIQLMAVAGFVAVIRLICAK